jgi:TatD DNase family protein
MYIDSHAHITSDTLYPQLDQILDRAKKANLSAIINIGTNIETLERGLLVSKNHPWIYNAGATHPHDVEKDGALEFPRFEQHAMNNNLIAIGEIGLDYYYTHSSKDIQEHYLRKYLQLALATNLPVIVHCREAFADFFRILDEEYTINGKHAPGILHCFTGTTQEAQDVLARGWYISMSGVVTFKKSEALRETLKTVPLSQLLIETDSPYLAPQAHRGKQNEPSFLPDTARIVAQVKEVPLEELAQATTHNTKTLFKLS